MRPSLFLATASILLAGPAATLAAERNGCYTRNYDAAHMSAHKNQTVATLKLKLSPRNESDGYPVNAEMRFDFRDSPLDWYAAGICQDSKDTLTCALDQDAGEVAIKLAAHAATLSTLTDVRADPSNGEESDGRTISHANSEDRSFALSEVPTTECAEFKPDE